MYYTVAASCSLLIRIVFFGRFINTRTNEMTFIITKRREVFNESLIDFDVNERKSTTYSLFGDEQNLKCLQYGSTEHFLAHSSCVINLVTLDTFLNSYFLI